MLKTATITRRTVPRTLRREIPTDDEPLTTADLKAIEAGRQAFARGDYCTLDELESDFKADVARQRRRPRAKSA